MYNKFSIKFVKVNNYFSKNNKKSLFNLYGNDNLILVNTYSVSVFIKDTTNIVKLGYLEYYVSVDSGLSYYKLVFNRIKFNSLLKKSNSFNDSLFYDYIISFFLNIKKK